MLIRWLRTWDTVDAELARYLTSVRSISQSISFSSLVILEGSLHIEREYADDFAFSATTVSEGANNCRTMNKREFKRIVVEGIIRGYGRPRGPLRRIFVLHGEQ